MITGDDLPLASVDPFESQIMINPSQTPDQWMKAFVNVNASVLSTAARNRRRIQNLVRMGSEALVTDMRQNLEGSSSRVHKNVRYSWNNRRLDVTLRRGFTCNNKVWIAGFLFMSIF